ncbi:hypothetical protein GUJ93_ZPchr0011g28844 [Zizania palustris]|uniref:Pectinesterase inhibitor domain-containing protein n=1 Tax=Zizania palustris TaxID=103762 RepID=A0A8J5WFK8_ZIZPA|nr:hypothetical protein GUJ93_ZPchr0011g28844 [Zizania palustris]
MATSLAPMIPLVILVVVVVVVAAGGVVVDATGEESLQSAQMFCKANVDPARCMTVVPTIPGIAVQPKEQLVAEVSVRFAVVQAREVQKMANGIISSLKYSGISKDVALKHQCLISCSNTVDLLPLLLSAAEPCHGRAPLLTEKTLLSIHRNLTGLFRKGEAPPLCVSSACPDKSCCQAEIQLVESMKNLWSLLDFIQVVLGKLYPGTAAASYQKAAAPAVARKYDEAT